MKHTPGPWTATERGEFVNAPNGRDICHIYGQRTLGEDKANARLIAAAPDLLAALQALAIVAESVAHLRGLEREILPATDAARAALSKALGE